MLGLILGFRGKLEEFAAKHKNEIRKDAAFRKQFQDMCASIGVDPLASSKGFWSELLGVGDFYYELSIQVGTPCHPITATKWRHSSSKPIVASFQSHSASSERPYTRWCS